MTDYNELIESLRNMEPMVCSTAADAIESLQSRVTAPVRLTDDQIGECIGDDADMQFQTDPIDCDISPRELSYALSEFHRAPSGDGALGFTWQDKPHRIVYDLIAAVKYYAMRVAELESRLEISPLHNVDGIMARDATIKLQDERIAELEAERAEREKQEPVAWYCDGEDGREYNGSPQMSNGRTGMPLYAAPPVTAPVRLTDTDFNRLYDEAGFDPNEMREAAEHMFDAIQSAVLRANGFKGEGASIGVPYHKAARMSETDYERNKMATQQWNGEADERCDSFRANVLKVEE